MEIQFLKKLQQNQVIEGQKIKGCSVADINMTENKFKLQFPKAYKEFLLLAGEYSGALHMDATSLDFLSKDSVRKMIEKELEISKIEIERPFWIFTGIDNFSSPLLVFSLAWHQRGKRHQQTI